MQRFDSKRALVTGAASGIGKATARILSEEGAYVALLDRDREATSKLASELGSDGTVPITVDVCVERGVAQAVSQIENLWGGIDLLHNHAGVLPAEDSSILAVEADTFRAALETNVTGQFLVAKYCAKVMAAGRGGSIVNTASDASLIALPQACSYVSSKAAIAGLTRSMAVDLAPAGIRVNAVCPGFVYTGMTAGLSRDETLMEKVREEYLTPELGQPEDVGNVVAFLLSGEARFMTGSLVVVDGGHTTT